MFDFQRLAGVLMDDLLHFSRKGGEQPGQLHVDTGVVGENGDLRRRRMAKRINADMGDISRPVDFGMRDLVDVVALHLFEARPRARFCAFEAKPVRNGDGDRIRHRRDSGRGGII